MSRHKAGPPSHLPLGFVFHILLIHLLGPRCTFEAENILLFASAELNLGFFVCQVHVFQSLRGDWGWCAAITLKRKTRGTCQSLLVRKWFLKNSSHQIIRKRRTKQKEPRRTLLLLIWTDGWILDFLEKILHCEIFSTIYETLYWSALRSFYG